MPRIGTSYKESGFTVGGSSSALGKKKTEAYEFYMSDQTSIINFGIGGFTEDQCYNRYCNASPDLKVT